MANGVLILKLKIQSLFNHHKTINSNNNKMIRRKINSPIQTMEMDHQSKQTKQKQMNARLLVVFQPQQEKDDHKKQDSKDDQQSNANINGNGNGSSIEANKAKANECPIVSSISSTKGAPNNDNDPQSSPHRTKGALSAPSKSQIPSPDDDIDQDDDESESLLLDPNNNNGNDTVGDGTMGGGEDIDAGFHGNGNGSPIEANKAKANECPIVSSISSTKGAPNNDNDESESLLLDPNNNNGTMGGGEDIDAGFTSNEDGWGSAPDEDHSDWGYDGQDYLPIKPSRIKKVQHRAWICEHCYAINNLITSIARDYQCACCAGRYRPGQKLIESSEQDNPVEQKPKWTKMDSMGMSMHLY
eukprot:CAMPEP_0201591784 /NCGR_PEP_ID=MMETSP0190_2-20130828/189851_1 /ASSEMBLY_ACC=CAM_ASM_000263 /TAXON_ID=37353 /ORGANISM="Rosalina sp." /LENGTH=356 /DNA_ID=CAMNT_0048050259 /DNA_START=804 /DNA_END=1875 /DNA_ORIENTATION=-